MPAPTYINSAYGGFFPDTAMFVEAGPLPGVQNGDVIVAVGGINSANTMSMSGGSQSWTTEITFTSAHGPARMYAWSYVASGDTSITPRMTRTGIAGTTEMALMVIHFRNVASIGVDNTASAFGAPAVTLPTLTAANSAIVSMSRDTDGVMIGTWRTNAGAFTEIFSYGAAMLYQTGYHPDAGPAASYVIGLTGLNINYDILALEVVGAEPPPPDPIAAPYIGIV